MRDYHRRLGPSHSPNLDEIRRAYRDLARRCRPRRGTHETGERLASSHFAHEILSDPQRQRPDGAFGRRASGREHVFTDEVDVDFPSVSNLVDRMRQSFFGDAPRHTLSAEVCLTPTQADSGVEVPLDVSLRHTCPACGGRGEIWVDPCGACGGSGAGLLPHQLQLIMPPGVRDGTCLRFDVTPPYAPVARLQVRISVR